MDKLLMIKWAAALIILSTSLIAGSLSFQTTHKRKWLPPLHSLANGIFLGVALFHFIPDSARSLKPTNLTLGYLSAILWTLVGLALLFIIERWALSFSDKSTHSAMKSMDGYVLAILLSIHAFIEGAALGIGQNEVQVSLVFMA